MSRARMERRAVKKRRAKLFRRAADAMRPLNRAFRLMGYAVNSAADSIVRFSSALIEADKAIIANKINTLTD